MGDFIIKIDKVEKEVLGALMASGIIYIGSDDKLHVIDGNAEEVKEASNE